MSGQDGTPVDRQLIARVVAALMVKDRSTQMKSGLARRAGNMGRTTLDRVFRGDPVYPATLYALDEALQVEAGTLEAVGRHDTDRLAELDIPANLRTVIDREMARGLRPERRRSVG